MFGVFFLTAPFFFLILFAFLFQPWARWDSIKLTNIKEKQNNIFAIGIYVETTYLIDLFLIDLINILYREGFLQILFMSKLKNLQLLSF